MCRMKNWIALWCVCCAFSSAFAGSGTKHPLHDGVAEGLTEQFGGEPSKWQHCKGHGILDYDGEERPAEVHWFQEKTGTVVGIAAVFSGFMGMLGSTGLGFVIPAVGWRAGYVIQGLLSAGLIVPVAVFLLRYRPEDMGLLAYGAKEAKPKNAENRAETGQSMNGSQKGGRLLSQPAFYMGVLIYGCSCAGAYLNSFLPSRGIEAGMALSAAAMLTSLALFGNMFSKFFLGRLCDSFGVILVLAGASLAALAGHVLLLFDAPAVIMTGACIYGITMPLSTVLLPLFCRLFWKGDAYGPAFSCVSMSSPPLSVRCLPMQTAFSSSYPVIRHFATFVYRK